MFEFIRQMAGKYCLKNPALKGPVLRCQEGDMETRNPVKRKRSRMGCLLVLPAVGLTILSLPASAQDTSFGQRLYQDKADCQFCHGIDGDGRGDPRSPGQAANLHKTILNREQLIEVIACGRPGTEMPHFDKYGYEDRTCYGRTASELGTDTPHDPHSTSLTMREIEAVADYVFARFVGK
jgi:mono/diheme cytochrome c family protein